MNSPLVSIVVTSYNRSHLLPQTMESIFSQSYQPVEIIVVDDGSTDDTQTLLETYGDKIRYIRQENSGVAVARTTGGRMARGEYIALQDDDDVMVHDRISNLMHTIRDYPTAVLAVGDWALINVNGELTGERSHFHIQKIRKTSISHPLLIEDGYKAVLWPQITPLPHTTLFLKEDAEKIGWFDKKFIYACSDTDFFARLARLGPIVYLPEVVSYYRRGHVSIWQNKLKATFSRLMLLEKHMLSLDHKNKALRKRLNRRMLSTLKQIAVLQTKDNSFGQIPEGISFNGIRLLSFRNRLNYRIYLHTIMPLRKRIMKSEMDQSLKKHLYRKINLHQTANRNSKKN